jgi:hypothetical protein
MPPNPAIAAPLSPPRLSPRETSQAPPPADAILSFVPTLVVFSASSVLVVGVIFGAEVFVASIIILHSVQV